MFTFLKRIIRFGWIIFFRNSGLSIAIIFILTMVICLATLFFLARGAVNFVIYELQERAGISVYFKQEILEEKILEIKQELEMSPQVKGVEYVSREAALEKFTQRHKDDPAIMESLAIIGVNPFSASLNIRAREIDYYAQIVNFLETEPFEGLIEKIDYQQRRPMIERLFAITSGINKVIIVLGSILVFIAVLVIFNTVKLAIYSSKEEISIMKLVGASNWFVRGPFLIQGAISGIFAFMICFLFFLGGLYFIGPKIADFLGFNLFEYFINNIFIIALIQIIISVGLGLISSLIAIKKYLKV